MADKQNRLAREKSPYLLQHATNPVDWFPWGADPLRVAAEKKRPLFVSIGYSTCHWCHVMAHESFADSEIAALLNRWFISVKVDREERPDVDQLYMAATIAMNGHGGWPLSVFLLPDGRPFYCATYIPPHSMPGRMGFKELLLQLHQIWGNDRAALEAAADSVLEAIQPVAPKPGVVSGETSAAKAFQAFKQAFDSVWGGFGKAPKFPRPAVLRFLMHYSYYAGEKSALDMALTTLRKMADGGMYDQVGGGFHRYSVDHQWRIPHFEKMLYDQAQLVQALLDALCAATDPYCAEIADQTLAYTLRAMTGPEQAFYSAEDADSDDPYESGRSGEGCFYLWTEEELVKSIGAAAANVFNYVYGVEFDGNALHDPHGEFTNRNVLYRKHSLVGAAEHFNITVDKVVATLQQATAKLFAIREKRSHPHLDDKIITSWNGMMIGAMARGGAILGNGRYIKAAQKAANFLKSTLYQADTAQLYRRFRDGEAAIKGQLDDYVQLVAGVIELYKVVQQPELLEWALELTVRQVELFWDSDQGCFFDSAEDPTLVARLYADYDGAEPAANSVALMNLLVLGMLTGRKQWLRMAEQIMACFSERMQTSPTALPLMQQAALVARDTILFSVVIGEPDNSQTQEMMHMIHQLPAHTCFPLLAENGPNQQWLACHVECIRILPPPVSGTTFAIVSDGKKCSEPISSCAELKERLLAGLE